MYDKAPRTRFRVHPTGWTQNGYRYEIFDNELRYEVLTDLCYRDALTEAQRLEDQNNACKQPA